MWKYHDILSFWSYAVVLTKCTVWINYFSTWCACFLVFFHVYYKHVQYCAKVMQTNIVVYRDNREISAISKRYFRWNDISAIYRGAIVLTIARYCRNIVEPLTNYRFPWAIYRLSLAIYRLNSAINRFSWTIYRLNWTIYRLNSAIYRLSSARYRCRRTISRLN